MEGLRPVNDYKFLLQNAEQNNLKMQHMATTFTITVTLLEEFQHRVMNENKPLAMPHIELLTKLKPARRDSLAGRHEKIATSLPRHLFGVALEFDTNITSWVEGEIS